MSLLGIDVGTTGCKSAAFREDGTPVATAYAEYALQMPQPGWAVLDAADVWSKVQATIGEVAAQTKDDPIQALAVSSLGEATVPVTNDRSILGPSILNFDVRGEQYLPRLAERFSPETLYSITGNTLGNHYGLTKLMWLQEHEPVLFDRARCFLPWASFVSFMLGAEPVVDYSLANRLLCFDIEQRDWSAEILHCADLDADKLPDLAATGTVVGTVAGDVADRLGLGRGVAIVAGCHDQCANAVGCGAIAEGSAAAGMGTYFCITPISGQRRSPQKMMRWGLNTEHHAVPGTYVSFIYNQGGALLRWFRDTFARREYEEAQCAGRDIYADLIAEVSDVPSDVLVLPHFVATGPPSFITNSSGVFTGLRLDTSRAEILKGILEGVVFYLRECVDALPETGIEVDAFHAAGGGSRSDTWLQICADIMGRPFTRMAQAEAGILGAAIIAGVGQKTFAAYDEAVATMVQSGHTFTPVPDRQRTYEDSYRHYRQLWPTMRGALSGSTGNNP